MCVCLFWSHIQTMRKKANTQSNVKSGSRGAIGFGGGTCPKLRGGSADIAIRCKCRACGLSALGDLEQ
jgi:hypothetical protein